MNDKTKKIESAFRSLGYDVKKRFKEGGEGIIYQAEKEQNLYAIKVIKDLRTEKVKRYNHEIESVQELVLLLAVL